MTKTIIAIAVTAAAYLIAGDARAATTTLDTSALAQEN